MGLLRDTLTSALGAGQVNNGFSGGLPWKNNSHRDASYDIPDRPRATGPSRYNFSNYDDGLPYSANGGYPGCGQSQQGMYRPANRWRGDLDPGYERRGSCPQPLQCQGPPPPYAMPTVREECYSPQAMPRDYMGQQQYGYMDNHGDGYMIGSSSFRPLALPQVDYGDGQPFLRAYSTELLRYNIPMRDFIRTIDAINVAIIPNPENQIFQKGATIAGFFVPGAASIGLMAGQLGVGVGAAIGHSSQVSKVLTEANLNLFLPNGLEICIGKAANVETEIGITPGNVDPGLLNASAQERVSYYGDYLAPLSQVLPPLQQCGRSDPIAMLGRGLSSKTAKKKLEKAQEDVQKGEHKDLDKLEKGVKWLIVRPATPEALAHLGRVATSNPSGSTPAGYGATPMMSV